MSEPSRTTPTSSYLRFFAVQLALTALEIGVAMVKDHPQQVAAALIALMIVNATFVAFNFMHLRWESPGLRRTVMVPLLFPVLYALVLISESAWRSLK